MKKFLILFILVFIFSFALISEVNAQAIGGNCPTPPTTCNPGLTCDGGKCVGLKNAACTIDDQCYRQLRCLSGVCSASVWGPTDADTLAAQAGLGTDDPREIVSNVINVIIGFLGILAVVLIIAGGFMWMTAAGNDDKISTSKKLMTAGVIGLVILLAAFGVAKFVVEALLGATGAQT
ncbi:MAG: hypothetical protein Q8Q23_05080 [bacterium]|nr:hypothetical protein [bacterium]